jgi:hypothetical protein
MVTIMIPQIRVSDRPLMVDALSVASSALAAPPNGALGNVAALSGDQHARSTHGQAL